jgi:hypothetical protein
MPYGGAFLNASCVGENRIRLSHDGFRRGKAVEHHCREIEVFQNSICISDAFSGRGRADICLIWQLGPDMVDVVSRGRDFMSMGDNRIQLHVLNESCDHQMDMDVDQRGFYSDSYGHVQSSSILKFRSSVMLPFKTKTTFTVEECVE